MIKVRFNLTIQDYYDYVRTNPSCDSRKRVINSLPHQLTKGYNLKYKWLKKEYNRMYRVHITIKVMNESQIPNLEEQYKLCCWQPSNISWKIIN